MTCRNFHSRAAAAAGAWNIIVQEFHTGGFERMNQLYKRIDVAADDAVARFHALNGGQREAGRGGQRSLIDANQGPRCT